MVLVRVLVPMLAMLCLLLLLQAQGLGLPIYASCLQVDVRPGGIPYFRGKGNQSHTSLWSLEGVEYFFYTYCFTKAEVGAIQRSNGFVWDGSPPLTGKVLWLCALCRLPFALRTASPTLPVHSTSSSAHYGRHMYTTPLPPLTLRPPLHTGPFHAMNPGPPPHSSAYYPPPVICTLPHP